MLKGYTSHCANSIKEVNGIHVDMEISETIYKK